MRIDVITIFPDYLAPLQLSLLGKAVERGLLDVHVHDLRDWTPTGTAPSTTPRTAAAPGMVMRPEPWGAGAGRRWSPADGGQPG